MHALRVGVIGASGYSGLELTRLLARHAQATLVFATSDRWVGQAVSARAGVVSELSYVAVEAGVAAAQRCDVVFLATPAESSLELVSKLSGPKVVDLSGAFRLRDASAYPKYYRFEHTGREALAKAVYGLPELFRERIGGAQLIANPGCYATAAALSVAPLLRAGLVHTDSVVITGASGVSGAGRKATEEYSFMEIDADYRAYKVLGHQHTPEIVQTVSDVAGVPVSVVFTPHLLPMKRGILCTSVARLKAGVSAASVSAAFADQFGREKLISVLPSADAVRVSDVANTPRTNLGVTTDGAHVVSICAIDNLLKGAASQAMQNLNLLFGLPETEGLS